MDRTAVHGSCIPFFSGRSAAGLWIVLAVGMATDLHAENLVIRPGVSLSEHYFDNSGDAFENTPDLGLVTELTPTLSARTKGQRVAAGLLYRMQNLWYQDNSDLNNTSHQLLADAKAELVNETLFLDLRASRTQQIVDPANFITSENITPNDNRTDVTTYEIAPSFSHRFGEFADFDANVSYADVSYLGESDNNSRSWNYYSALRNGSESQRLKWEVSFNKSKFIRDSSEDQSNTTSLLALGYDISNSLTAIGSVGYEKTDVPTSDGKDSGSSLTFGANWHPTTRTTVAAAAGRRFYGNTYLFNLTHSQKRNRWSFIYDENITNPSEVALANEIFDNSLAGNTESDPGGEDSGTVTGSDPNVIENRYSPAIYYGDYLSRKFTAVLTRESSRTSARIRVFSEDRELAIGGESERVYGGDVSWSWAMGSRTTSILGGDWEQQKLAASGGQSDEIWGARVEFVRQLGRRTFGKLRFNHTERDSPEPATSYEQNQVTLNFNLQL